MDIVKLTLAELSAALEAKKLSSREATLAYYDQIERRDGELNAYITLTRERALARADEADSRRAAGGSGALLGVPMAIKDNVCTAGVRTTCASRMLENFVPDYSATVFERLEDAGAVMLGKTNLDEFAMGSTTGSSYFGRSLNPRETGYVPGGSSGGSAAAVAAGEAVFALGTDTGGSIRQPAAFCGIVGLKPTYGSVSRYGITELASSLDQAGPLTRTARDCAILMNTIAFHDPRDGASQPRKCPDFTAGVDAGVKGIRIALLTESFGDIFSDDIKTSLLAAAEDFRRMGATVEEVSAPTLMNALPAYYILSCTEASANLARFDGVRIGRRAGGAGSAEELIRRSRSEGFGAEVKRRLILGAYVLSGENYADYYEKALKVRTLVIREYARLFENYDLVLTPTTPTTAYRIGGSRPVGDARFISDLCTVAANLAGVPAMNLPCGVGSSGLPIGMQLVAPMFGESTIFRAACAFERERGAY